MQAMRFEARELKPYAEPVSATHLKEGAVYFFLNFSDEAMLLPTLEPVVFIGRNLETDDAGIVYFQDARSFNRGIRYGSPTKDVDAMFYCGSDKETGHVFEYDHALDELMRCALRRKQITGL